MQLEVPGPQLARPAAWASDSEHHPAAHRSGGGRLRCAFSDPHVTMRVGENEIESVITRRSAEELSLKKGDVVIAVVKATEVMISKW